VNAVVFGPDGLLASAGDDGTVRLWNTAGRQPVGAPLRAPGPLGDVAFSLDGTLLAAGAADGSVTMWEAPGWQPL